MVLRILSLLGLTVYFVEASPFPQAVTAIIAPPEPAPSGCMQDFSGAFGIAVLNRTSAAPTSTANAAPFRRQVSQIGDGQIQAPAKSAAITPISSSTQLPAPTGGLVSQIGDGQVQGSLHTAAITPAPQASSTANGRIITSTAIEASPASTSSIEAPSFIPSSNSTSASSKYFTCRTSSTLEMTLKGGILKDRFGRTGYIASNYQFQFDDPPQAGAIITAGFSVCQNGSLALGGSNVFWQCLSGSFYNLYDRNWAAQCSPVTIETLALRDC